jgi:hypothetical protein
MGEKQNRCATVPPPILITSAKSAELIKYASNRSWR